jgi:hypothetical protein
LPGAAGHEIKSEEAQNRSDLYKCFAYGIMNKSGLEALHEGPTDKSMTCCRPTELLKRGGV